MKKGQMKKKYEGLKGQGAALKNMVAGKRTGVSPSPTLYMTVIRVEEFPVGHAMKYPRMTEEQSVPTTNLSLDGIKKACSNYFQEDLDRCVLLISDKGGQIMDISQINPPYLKLFKRLGQELTVSDDDVCLLQEFVCNLHGG